MGIVALYTDAVASETMTSLEVVRTRELERTTADFAYSNYNGIKVARCVVIIRLNSVQQDFVAVVTSDQLAQLVLVYSPPTEFYFHQPENVPPIFNAQYVQHSSNFNERNFCKLPSAYALTKVLRHAWCLTCCVCPFSFSQ